MEPQKDFNNGKTQSVRKGFKAEKLLALYAFTVNGQRALITAYMDKIKKTKTKNEVSEKLAFVNYVSCRGASNTFSSIIPTRSKKDCLIRIKISLELKYHWVFRFLNI